MIVAFAWPPPSHMVCRPDLPPVPSSSCSSLVIRIAPVAPSGCPRAIAPPFGFVFFSEAPVSADQASSTGANASLTSNTSISSIFSLPRASACSVAGIGPVSMNTGSAPTTVSEWIRARGVKPCRRTASSDAISTAAEPSEICEAVAAVSSQPSRRGFSSAIFSREVSRRGASSVGTPRIPAPPQRLQLSQSLQGRFPAGSLVGRDPVDRRDLAVEPALVDRVQRPGVALQRELFELRPPQAPLLAHQLRAAELGDFLVAVPVPPALPERARHALLQREGHGGAHRHHAHALHAGRDDQVLCPGHDGLGGKVHGLLR